MMDKLYYNFPNPAAFSAVKNLQQQSKLPMRDVKSWLAKQRTYSLHKPIKRRYATRAYRAKYRNQFWETDLVDMQKFANENKQHKYIITIIDIFSRFGFAYPLKDKTVTSVTNVFKNLFISQKPRYLSSDEGKEFKGGEFQQFLRERGVNQFFRQAPFKAAVCERFNRTLKTRIVKYFTHNGHHRWVEILDDVVEAYNNSFHRTIKMTPSEAYQPKNKMKVFTIQENRINDKKKKEGKKERKNIGDYVRITKYKDIFEKGYTPNWSEEVFRIFRIHDKYTPVMYSLKDLNGEMLIGKFYNEELQKVSKPEYFTIESIIKSVGKKSLVKFLHYPTPEWIDTKSINKISQSYSTS